VDEHVQTYNLLTQTLHARPELTQNLLGGVRTLEKVLTLQEAGEIVTREKEKHTVILTSGTPTYEQDIGVSSDVAKLHVYLYHGEGDANLHLYDGSAHVGFNDDKSANDIEFPASYTGPQSNPEIITVPDAAGKTFHLKIKMTQPSGQNNVTGTIIILEEPLRPVVMATSPSSLEIDASPGQKSLTLSVRIGEASQQSPLKNLNATISSLKNAYGQLLTLTSSATYSNSVLSGGAEETITFTFDVPNDATKIYTGTITISSDNAGEIIKNVTIRVDSDEDGLPDYWEKLYNFNPEQPGEANLDSDGDGYTNLQEYQFGTDPLDPLDHPTENVSTPSAPTGPTSGSVNSSYS
jgi:hypothetical protein